MELVIKNCILTYKNKCSYSYHNQNYCFCILDCCFVSIFYLQQKYLLELLDSELTPTGCTVVTWTSTFSCSTSFGYTIFDKKFLRWVVFNRLSNALSLKTQEIGSFVMIRLSFFIGVDEVVKIIFGTNVWRLIVDAWPVRIKDWVLISGLILAGVVDADEEVAVICWPLGLKFLEPNRSRTSSATIYL